MKRLIVNADDFGYCEAVNTAILRTYTSGIVRSTTMMANMPGFDHAVSLAKANPGLKIGVHMTMTCYKPVLTTHKTLVDEHGYFDKSKKDEFDLDELYAEFKAQIEKVKQAGIEITHLDSHHHVHTFDRLQPVIERLAKEYRLPIRGGFKYEMPYEPKSELCGKFYQKTASLAYLEEFLSTMEEDKIYDMMCHPAYLDNFLYKSSSYAVQRLDEFDILVSDEAKALLEKYQVKLVDYTEFKAKA